jgi:hypothetical protein
MAQGNQLSRPKTSCCRCRKRADGASRLTNLGWLCDHCYELLHRSTLGRRLYRLVYQIGGETGVGGDTERRPRIAAQASAGARSSGSGLRPTRTAAVSREKEATEALVA